VSGHRIPRISGSSTRVTEVEGMVIRTSNEDVQTVISGQIVSLLYIEQSQPEDTIYMHNFSVNFVFITGNHLLL
jgi:hypothetical protein